VVTAVGVDEELELVPDEDEDELVVVGVELAVVLVVLPLEAVVAVLCASAGSLPETSWAAITPQIARNAVSVTAAMRRRMARIRRRRPSRRARPSSRGVRFWVSVGGVVMSTSFDAGPSPRVWTG
jgi:hypothetical protein